MSMSDRQVQATYDRALRQLDERIQQAEDQLQRIRIEARVRAAKGEGQGYEVLVEQAQQLVVELKSQRRQLEHERITAPAAKKLADAAIGIHDDATGLGASATSSALGSVRDQIDALNRRAHGSQLDSDGNPIHARRAALDRKVKEDRARAELERLKAELRGETPEEP